MRENIVISAVNLVEGGPLAILGGCLRYLSENLADRYRIIALVNRKDLFSFSNIEYLEFPNSKRSWINRIYYEYFYFYKLSKKMNPLLWLSLHDMTPNVIADRLAVYCHNASSFYRIKFSDLLVDPKFVLFNFFYKYLYAINIKKADFVIVQQEWFRRSLIKLFNPKNVIVAYPGKFDNLGLENRYIPAGKNAYFVFFYPSFPRVFKNFEVIGKAAESLLKRGIKNFEVIFTISGFENPYSKSIYKAFKDIKNIKFIGIQKKSNMPLLYNNADCVIFPSKLETWGLPITEAKNFLKPLLLADLEYAHETLGAYDKAIFFNPNNYAELADIMEHLINKTSVFKMTKARIVLDPFSEDWKGLFNLLLTNV